MAAQVSEPAEARPLGQRFRELDGLRGLAALAVVASHFGDGHNSHFLEDPRAFHDFAWGAYGVQLFFLISGFVILMSARGARRPSDFVISRVSRLYPVYWLSLALAVVLLLLRPVPGFQLSLPDVLVNTTMIQRWVLVPNVVDVYWTLAVEMQFYVIVLLALLLTRSRLTDRAVLITAVSWTAVSWAVALAVMSRTAVDPQLDPMPVKLLTNLTVAEYAPLFVLGMALYLVRHERRHMLWAALAAVSAVASAVVLRGPLHGALVAAAVLIFTVVVLRESTRVLLWSPVQFYGRVSYSLYVIHAIPGYLIIHGTWPLLGRTGAMVLALAVVSLLAWIAHLVGERWGSRQLKRAMLAVRERADRRQGPGR